MTIEDVIKLIYKSNEKIPVVNRIIIGETYLTLSHAMYKKLRKEYVDEQLKHYGFIRFNINLFDSLFDAVIVFDDTKGEDYINTEIVCQ